MTASADVITDVRENCLGVPIQSVTVRTVEQLGIGSAEEDGAESAPRFEPDDEGFVEIVWVVENGSAVARQVETGIQSESHIEVVVGLDQDEQVVVGSYRAISRDLQDGSLVQVGGPEAEGQEG